MIGRSTNESADYTRKRDELLKAEIALRDQRERVAELRRGLPLDEPVEDYVFTEGPRDLSSDEPLREVRLAELFEDPAKPLVLIQYMYGGTQTGPCPMCTMWADGYNAVAPHLRQKTSLAVVAEAEVGALRALARDRNWADLRLLSSGGSTFKTDFAFQSADGDQYPGISVFARDPQGEVRHFYSASAIMGPDAYRGMDLLSPVWNVLDLTPGGRGEWFPGISYD
jgi:predicted dithiol-disulfide oxidoreductase (DUF899 family)